MTTMHRRLARLEPVIAQRFSPPPPPVDESLLSPEEWGGGGTDQLDYEGMRIRGVV